jgi:hypothetical protein
MYTCAGIAQSVERLATGWRVRVSNPGGVEIFRTHPDRPRIPPSLLYTGYRFSFPGVKRSGRGVDHPLSSSAGVKERVELYFYSSSGLSWPGLGRTLPLPYKMYTHIYKFLLSHISHSSLISTNWNVNAAMCPVCKHNVVIVQISRLLPHKTACH